MFQIQGAFYPETEAVIFTFMQIICNNHKNVSMRFFHQNAFFRVISTMTRKITLCKNFLYATFFIHRLHSYNYCIFRMYANEPDRQRKCSRCLLDIQPSDLVMKARNFLFHVDCFRCARCDAALKKGDFYGMFESMPYCQLHYELLASGHSDTSVIQPPSHSGGTFSPQSLTHSPVEGMPHATTGGVEHDEFSPQGSMPAGLGYPPYPLHGGPDQQPPPGWYPGPPGDGPYPNTEYPFENNNSTGMLKKRRGRKKRKVDAAFAASMGGYMDPSMGGYPPHPGMDGSQMDHGKSKRARTSFKHHQLRIMRNHFQINQNPDSRELKMLSQKTGLDKKVLQVFFYVMLLHHFSLF